MNSTKASSLTVELRGREVMVGVPGTGSDNAFVYILKANNAYLPVR